MFTTFVYIVPVFALIALGFWFKHAKFLPDAFWGPAEKLGYWVLLPSLIIDSLATKDLSSIQVGGFMLSIATTIVVLSVALLALRRFSSIPGPSYASMHQGAIRLNGLLAIAICVALFGPDSLALTALMVATWVPLSNGLSVYAFVALASDERPSVGQIALAVVKNPNVFSVFIGLTLNYVGAGAFLDQFIFFELLGRAALPIGLIAVGAALDFRALESAPARLIVTIMLKLVIMPLGMLVLAVAYGLGPLATAVAVVCAAMPTSPGGYLIAQQLKGDAPLMASIITLQTAGALITVTLFAQYGVNIMSPG